MLKKFLETCKNDPKSSMLLFENVENITWRNIKDTSRKFWRNCGKIRKKKGINIYRKCQVIINLADFLEKNFGKFLK